MLRRRDRNCALTSSCAELHGAALDSSDRAHVRGASAGFRAPQEALADEKEPLEMNPRGRWPLARNASWLERDQLLADGATHAVLWPPTEEARSSTRNDGQDTPAARFLAAAASAPAWMRLFPQPAAKHFVLRGTKDAL